MTRMSRYWALTSELNNEWSNAVRAYVRFLEKYAGDFDAETDQSRKTSLLKVGEHVESLEALQSQSHGLKDECKELIENVSPSRPSPQPLQPITDTNPGNSWPP